jgi:hypothetical protein
VPELREAVAQMEKRTVAAAGSATVPDVRWSDVGGQHEAKASCLPPLPLAPPCLSPQPPSSPPVSPHHPPRRPAFTVRPPPSFPR